MEYLYLYFCLLDSTSETYPDGVKIDAQAAEAKWENDRLSIKAPLTYIPPEVVERETKLVEAKRSARGIKFEPITEKKVVAAAKVKSDKKSAAKKRRRERELFFERDMQEKQQKQKEKKAAKRARLAEKKE